LKNSLEQGGNMIGKHKQNLQFILVVVLLLVMIALAQPIAAWRQAPRRSASNDWLLWGGPRRDFITGFTGLASTWPKDGPRKLWTRALGDGYSPISVEGTTLYTAYHSGSQDVIVAIDTRTGKNLWEYTYESRFQTQEPNSIGPGPYAMPQVFGDRLVTASGGGKIHSIDKKTGRPVWSRDLLSEFGGTRLVWGYSCHALPYKDGLILLAGGRGSGALALRKSDGAVIWKNLDFRNAHSSPLLIEVDGQPQVVALLASEVIGINPENGQMLWRHPHNTQYGLAISTPVWAPGNLLFISSAYNGGSRVLQLSQSAGKTAVKELWHSPRLQVHFGTVIRLGDYLYCSSGESVALMTCVNLRTGKIAWEQRGFSKAQLVAADGKLILLDEDGTLGLVKVTPKGLQILAKTSVLQSTAWTPPTLAGRTLYLRDRKNLMALDLAGK
jgi:outer membrane protein assembly factor BamB